MVQAAVGAPLTVYGNGSQTRGFLNIRDTIACVELACDNPSDRGDFRIFNQFTEQFSVSDLAEKVRASGERTGLQVKVNNIDNPRVEQENHYYNAKHSKLVDLGLTPHLLDADTIDTMLATVCSNCENVDTKVFTPRIKWDSTKKS